MIDPLNAVAQKVDAMVVCPFDDPSQPATSRRLV